MTFWACVCLPALFLFLTPSHSATLIPLIPLFPLFPLTSWWVLSESRRWICVSSLAGPLLPPEGFACAGLTSETLRQQRSDVLRCVLKKLPGDGGHSHPCHRRPTTAVVVVVVLVLGIPPPAALMEHSQDAGLQSAALGAGRQAERRSGLAAGREVVVVGAGEFGGG